MRNPAGEKTMAIQPTHRRRILTKLQAGRIVFAILLAGLVLADRPMIAQTRLDTFPSQGDPTPPMQATTERIGLKQVVKIVIEPGTNRILLVGLKEDVAIVIQTLNSINEGLKAKADPTVTEKVVLQSQLADTVASIMSSSLDVHDPGGPEVKINAVHFPEAILLTGPASAVRRAKQLLATIDCYEGLSGTDAPAPKRID